MDEQKKLSYMAIESVLVRQERTIKRIWILCILLILCLVGSNTAWIIYENSFEDVVTIEQDAEWDQGKVIFNGTGEVSINGESTSENN